MFLSFIKLARHNQKDRYRYMRIILVIIKIFLAAIITVVLTLFSAEWIIGFKKRNLQREGAHIPFPEPVRVNTFIDDKTGDYIPYSSGYQNAWNGKGYVKVEINSLGCRGPEYLIPKSLNTFRICFVGDSVVFGSRIRFEDTIPQRVEAILNKDSSHFKYEVVNGGVGDKNLKDEINFIRDKLILLEPDIILLGFYLNDFATPAGYLAGINIYENHLLHRLNKLSWVRKSNLWNFVLKGLERRINGVILNSYLSGNSRHLWVINYEEKKWLHSPEEFNKLIEAVRYDWGMAWKDEIWEDGVDLLKEIQEICLARNIIFAVIIFPVEAQVLIEDHFSDNWRKPQDKFILVLKRNNIPYLDLLPILRTHRNEDIFWDHCHFTPRGAAIAGEAIADFLKETLLAQK